MLVNEARYCEFHNLNHERLNVENIKFNKLISKFVTFSNPIHNT